MAAAICQRMWRLAAEVAAMIRIDALWLETTPIDMRIGAERLMAQVVQVFGSALAISQIKGCTFKDDFFNCRWALLLAEMQSRYQILVLPDEVWAALPP